MYIYVYVYICVCVYTYVYWSYRSEKLRAWTLPHITVRQIPSI